MMETSLKYDGLIFPELALMELIEQRLQELQADQTKLAAFFQKLDRPQRDSFINYLSQRQIGVHLGWSALLKYETPQIVITAATSDEDHPVGDALDERTVPIETLVAEVDADFTPVAQILNPETVAQTLTVTAVTGTWPTSGVIVVGDEWMSYEGDFASGSVSIVRRGLSGSRIVSHISGEPIVRVEILKLYGLDEIGSYWIDVCHTNSAFVIVLAQIVKLALLRATRADPTTNNQPYFTTRGILRPTLRTTDLAPHRTLYPTTAMLRSLFFTCRYQLALDERFELVHRPNAVGTVVFPDYVEGGS